jgi:hypothetical protein
MTAAKKGKVSTQKQLLADAIVLPKADHKAVSELFDG